MSLKDWAFAAVTVADLATSQVTGSSQTEQVGQYRAVQAEQQMSRGSQDATRREANESRQSAERRPK